MLEVENIVTGYGKKQVLSNLSFLIEKGDIALLNGANGSGKSTVLKTIYGLLKPWNQEGVILFEKKCIVKMQPFDMIPNGIVYIPQKKNVFEDFTVEENLFVSAGRYNRQEIKNKVKNVFEFIPKLELIRKQTPFHLSGGEKQLLAFANVLIHSPKLVLLDEPFAGMDIQNSDILKTCICELNKKSVTFILVEHKRQLVEDIVNKVFKLELGKIVN